MKYAVNIYKNDQLIVSTPNCTVGEAEKIARNDARKYPDCLVFVEFFRESDGQHGYLNQDGHAITGIAWD